MIKKNLKFIKNFSSLTALQISNYIFPLITFPYLVRVLGVENFGTANFIFAFIYYFISFTEYGFNLSATQQVSIYKNNHEQLHNIFNSTITVKTILSAISFLLLLLVIISFQTFRDNYIFYLVAFMFVIGNVFYPDWFLQGMEKMQYLAFVTIPLRVISTIAIFLFVLTDDDLLLYIIITGIYQFLVGLILFVIVKNKFEIKYLHPSKYQLLRQFKKGWHIFLSKISINIYTSSNVFLLGLLSGNLSVGYFTGANKIREAVQGIFSNMGTTMYPHFSEQLIKNKNEGISLLKKYLKLISSLSFVAGIIIFLFSEEIILFLLGQEYLNSIEVLRVLAFLPFIITFSNVFGIQLMLNTGYSKEFNKIIAAAALLNLVLMFVLVPNLNEQGAALSMLFAEIFVTGTMGIFVIKRKLFQ